jgi:hypothetical protein
LRLAVNRASMSPPAQSMPTPGAKRSSANS